MPIDLFEIDKSGSDLLNRDYSVVVVKNNQTVFGYKIEQHVKDELTNQFRKGLLNISNDNVLNFKIRFHTAIIILLMKEAIKRREKLDECKVLICNDYDGHFHEIKDMFFTNLKPEMPTLDREKIIMAKFPPESLIQRAAKSVYKGDKEEMSRFNLYHFDIEQLKDLIKKARR